jgi:hypothetical protein
MSATSSKRRVAMIATVAGALTVLAQVAQAAPPDVVERAAASRAANPSFAGSPDAIDRAVAARQAEAKFTALEARERALTERPGRVVRYAPDAIERALNTHTNDVTHQKVAMLDNRERALVFRPTPTTTAVGTQGGLDWSDFGLGAGAGLVLLLGTLGAGFLVARHGRKDVARA